MDIPLDQRDSKVDIPVFANARVNLSKGKIVPFLDGKAGTYVNNNGGLYVLISAGCRLSIDEKQAVNVSIGFTREELEFETFAHFTSNYNMNYTTSPRKLTTEGFAIKIGYEF